MSKFDRERIILMGWIFGYSAVVYFFVEAHWTIQFALAFGFAWQLMSGYGGKGQLENVVKELDRRRIEDFNLLKEAVIKLQEQQTALEMRKTMTPHQTK